MVTLFLQAPGQPNVSYALYAGNRLYTEHPGVEFVPNAGLLLRSVRPDHAGYYLIVVNSHDGTGRVSLEERRVNLVVASEFCLSPPLFFSVSVPVSLPLYASDCVHACM